MKRNEIISFLISALVLGFVFSFREWGYSSFSLAEGLGNWAAASILSLIALLFHHLGILIIAKKYFCDIEYKLWTTSKKTIVKFSFFLRSITRNISPSKFYSGIVLSFLFSIFSNGYIKFAAIGITELTENTSKRLKTKYKYLSEYEQALVHLAGPFANLLLALVLTAINYQAFSNLIGINYYLAIFSLLPIGNLDGAKILFGSKLLYIFSIVFLIFAIALIQVVNFWATIFLATIIAFIFLMIRIYKNV